MPWMNGDIKKLFDLLESIDKSLKKEKKDGVRRVKHSKQTTKDL